MKFLVTAIVLHVLTELFWDEFTADEIQSANYYLLGMAGVLFLWAASHKYDTPTVKSKIVASTWLFLLGGSVVQEFSRTTGILENFFLNPTHKHLSMINTAAIAAIYVFYQLNMKPKFFFSIAIILAGFVIIGMANYWFGMIILSLLGLGIIAFIAGLLSKNKMAVNNRGG